MKKFEDSVIQDAMKRYAAGESSRSIADSLKINQQTVYAWKKRYGLSGASRKPSHSIPKGMTTPTRIPRPQSLDELKEENLRLKVMIAEMVLKQGEMP